MKKLFLLPGLMLALACNNSSDNAKKAADTTTTAKTNDLSNNPDYQKGLELVAKNDCFTCHQIDDKLNGPPYREVANKYASYPDTIINHLAHKIISGGNGVWGEVMMTPHPSLSETDAEALVKYILLLKK
ncbi:MAG TPA: c-type cytochrome [Chitinophagaceae bacterium]|jgi:cytochrome c|nr:c-type cytochrome [Chitinophagaceae bacterium]